MDESQHILISRDALVLAGQGKEAWNEWAISHANWRVSFENAKLQNRTGATISFSGFEFPGDVVFDNAEFLEGTSFEGANFCGRAFFRQVNFRGDAIFDEAVFEGRTDFSRTRFIQFASFEGVKFLSQNKFDNAHFMEGASFESAEFHRHTWFGDVIFHGDCGFRKTDFVDWVSFGDSEFRGTAGFEEMKFRGGAGFHHVQFSADAWFSESEFSKRVSFEGAQFDGEATFSRVKFMGCTDFERSRFGREADFEMTEFHDEAEFNSVHFCNGLNLTEASFEKAVSFRASRFMAALRLDSTRFSVVPDFQSTRIDHHVSMASAEVTLSSKKVWKFWKGPTRVDDAAKFRRLKEMAILAQDHFLEQTFFAFEQIAMRGSRYSGSAMIPGFLYEAFSDFGRSLKRPLVGLLVVWTGFAITHSIVACQNFEETPSILGLVGIAMVYSAAQIFPFVSGAGGARSWALEELYFGAAPAVVHGLNILEGLLAFVFLFLIGLAFRNRFRI